MNFANVEATEKNDVVFEAINEAQKHLRVVRPLQNNPHLKSKYASLSDVMSLLYPSLEKHGLMILQPVTGDGQTVTVNTIIRHVESGEALSFAVSGPVVKGNNAVSLMQMVGQAATYLRRYAITSFFAMVVDHDDDANVPLEPKPEVDSNKNESSQDDTETSLSDRQAKMVHSARALGLTDEEIVDCISVATDGKAVIPTDVTQAQFKTVWEEMTNFATKKKEAA